jgi:hypothetical protein
MLLKGPPWPWDTAYGYTIWNCRSAILMGGFKFGRKHRSHALIEVVDGKDVQTIVRGGAGAN